MEKKVHEAGKSVYYWQTGSLFFGLVLTIIGGYYFGKAMGWIKADFPIWSSLVIFFGLLFILSSFRRAQY